jgi:hypothetical protein
MTFTLTPLTPNVENHPQNVPVIKYDKHWSLNNGSMSTSDLDLYPNDQKLCLKLEYDQRYL